MDVGRVAAACGDEQLALFQAALRSAPQPASASSGTMSDYYAEALASVLAGKLVLESRLAEVEAEQRELTSVNRALRAALERQAVALELLAEENVGTLSAVDH